MARSEPRKFGLRLFLKNSKKKKKFSLYERQPRENSQCKLTEGQQLAVAKSRQTLQNKHNVFYFSKEAILNIAALLSW